MIAREEGIGLEHRRVRVVDYDPRWTMLFQQIADEIREMASSPILSVEHVGSTSIPGLAAKPILDLLVLVPDFEEALRLVPDLETLGFEYRPQEDISDRHYFRRPIGDVRTHHLSLAEPGSHHALTTLAFRDALRADAGLAQEYHALKLDLAARFPLDREAYLDGKFAFVSAVLRACGLA